MSRNPVHLTRSEALRFYKQWSDEDRNVAANVITMLGITSITKDHPQAVAFRAAPTANGWSPSTLAASPSTPTTHPKALWLVAPLALRTGSTSPCLATGRRLSGTARRSLL